MSELLPAARDGSIDWWVLPHASDPDVDDEATVPAELACLHCLIEEGDEQLARGLDLVRVHGQVDFDPETLEWFVPEDTWRA